MRLVLKEPGTRLTYLIFDSGRRDAAGRKEYTFRLMISGPDRGTP